MTDDQLIEILKETRIDWSATPQSVMSPSSGVIRTQEDFEAYQQRDRDLVGYGYFYCDVRNMRADLALMRSTRPGWWETKFVPQRISPLLLEDLERSIEVAGGAMNWSGHYPLDELCLDKLRLSYIGEY